MDTRCEPQQGSPPRRQIGLRLDGDLFDSLTEDAAANGRTVAQSIRYHVRRSMEMAA